MVSTDSKATILNYVRNCFASGDDSGFCEKLLNKVKDVTDEEIESILSGQYFNEVVNTDSDDFYRHSPECAFVPCEDPLSAFYSSINSFEDSQQSSLSHKKNASNIRQLSAEEVDKYFPSKPIVRTNKPDTALKSEKSGLTLALEQAKLSGHLKRNKLFSDFAIYDARSTLGTNQRVPDSRFPDANVDPSLRQFNVWLWRLRGFPRTSIKVQPRLGTTVQQFVGLTLWQYFNEFSTSDVDSTLAPTQLDDLDESFLNRLALHMFDTLDDEYDDNEDVDSEFPPLELNDPIHKYEFKSFALVERVQTPLEEASKKEISHVLVTIHMAQGMSVLRFPSDTCLSTVLERAVYRRRLRQHGGYAYRLELWPRNTDQQNNNIKSNNILLNKNSQLDLSKPLSYFIAAGLPLHFLLVRESSRCDTALSDQNDDIEATKTLESMLALDTTLEPVHTALHLRQYQVTYLKGLFPPEVQLNISSNELKIEQKRPKLFSKLMKPIIIQINAIADCELITSGYSTCGIMDKPSMITNTTSTNTTTTTNATNNNNSSIDEFNQKFSSPNYDSHSDWITSQLTTSIGIGGGGRSSTTSGQQQPHILVPPSSTSTIVTCFGQDLPEVTNPNIFSSTDANCNTNITMNLNTTTSNMSTTNITTSTSTTNTTGHLGVTEIHCSCVNHSARDHNRKFHEILKQIRINNGEQLKNYDMIEENYEIADDPKA
ncbi:hypothetical protein Smp_136490 [Schistosoma mansoni]|uniref:hypothetical protein n=1 Tax=Schistosoma mansoni TaxID=6183 RepID=UPI0001A64188|nr:hypothetical protein Smp_136490 [Schistosoma mansoni]|eukprot:XP_018655562.1 hypothetical protein Smp_136490 [Schistosoma mansoni]